MKAKKASERFLYRKEHEILELDWTSHAGHIDIIFQGDETIVFTDVLVGSGSFGETDRSDKNRERLEQIAISYFTEHKLCNIPVSFDVNSVVPVGKERALIRNHIQSIHSN